MKKKDTAIRTARISAYQAIAVALIGVIPGILGTLYATGNLSPARHQGTTASVTQTVPAVLEAPHLHFLPKKIDLSLEKCKEKAVKAVDEAKLTGQVAKEHIVWGYWREMTGVIWCNTDDRVVIFLAAGKHYDNAIQMVDALAKSF